MDNYGYRFMLALEATLGVDTVVMHKPYVLPGTTVNWVLQAAGIFLCDVLATTLLSTAVTVPLGALPRDVPALSGLSGGATVSKKLFIVSLLVCNPVAYRR